VGGSFELKNCVTPSDFSNRNINRYSEMIMSSILIFVYVNAYIDRIGVMLTV
jgi:hypothetical protein